MISEMATNSISFLADLADFLISAPVLPFVGLFITVVIFGVFRAVIDR